MVVRLRQEGPEPVELGPNEALLSEPATAIGPDQTVLVLERNAAAAASATRRIVVPNEFEYLRDGDVLAVEPERHAVRVLYRRNSQHNSVLLTERCNHY